MSSDLETKKAQTSPAFEPNPATTSKVGLRTPNTLVERVLVILSRYRETSIAVVAIALVIYFQIGSGGEFLTSQDLSVVLRDTARIGLIAIAEVMLMITGEIDLSVGSTFSIAPYVMVLMSVLWDVPLAVSAVAGVLIGVLVGVVNGIITVRFRVPSLITTVGTLFFLQGIASRFTIASPS